MSHDFKIDISLAEWQERLTYLNIGEEDAAVLKPLHETFVARRETFLDRFYDHLLGFNDRHNALATPQIAARARQGQATYMERMLLGDYDLEFYRLSVRVGLRHQELGLEPRWVVGAWTMYLTYWTDVVCELFPDDKEKRLRTLQALQKVNMLALQLMVDAYYASTLERVQAIVSSQREAILELSTPVIEISDGVMVLPLIGTIDSVRTRQIMDSLLNRVVETQAEIVILDLTGVAVVDTAVANHLMKTVEAAELLGTRCIITGISPAIAQTLVHLGVDLGRITTSATLRTGLKLAWRSQGVGLQARERAQ
ncbi:MAG: STAS domain-containing protein [Proteobacteria bacterium]|nr:STAS domain-containing protein [Pseudomonadota bacterium]